MKIALPATILICFAIVADAAAQVHKWVDENGVTVYSQTAPREPTQAQTIETPSSTAVDAEAAKQQLDETIKKFDEMDKDRRVSEEKQQIKERQKMDAETLKKACEQAREYLASLESGRPQKIVVSADGQAKRLSYEELQKEIEDTRKFIDEACTGS